MFDNIKYDFCTNCGDKKIIVNKKYCLCEICNKKRRGTYKVKRKPIPKFSKKEKDNKKKLNEVYEQMDKTSEKICSGCGQRDFLSHSHLITQRNKNYQSDPDNIVYDCLQRNIPDKFGNLGCHARWESKDIEKIKTLHNWPIRLAYIKDKDPVLYRKITS